MLVATYKVRGPSIYTWGNCGLGHEVLAWARRAKGRAGCEPGSLAPWPLAGWPQHLSPHIRGQLPALLSSTRASRQGLHPIASGHPTLPAPPVGMRRSRPWSLLAQVRGHSQRSQCSWSSHLCLESHPPWSHCPSPLRHCPPRSPSKQRCHLSAGLHLALSWLGARCPGPSGKMWSHPSHPQGQGHATQPV